MNFPILVVDTEGSGLYPDDGARVSVVSWATRNEAGEIESGALPFGQGPFGQLFDFPEDAGSEAWEKFLDRCEQSSLIMHNASHDLAELNAGSIKGYPGRNLIDRFYWDTSVVQRHLDPLERVGLEDSCVRRLHIEPWKWRAERWKANTIKQARKLGDLTGNPRYDLIPWSEIDPYATEDAVNTLLLAEDQWARLAAGEGIKEIVDRELDITRVLFLMEVRGVSYAAEESEAAGIELMRRAGEVEGKLPEELQPPTPAKFNEYFYRNLGYKPTKRDKEGNLVEAADDYSRKGLRAQGAPWMDELDEWSKLETAYTSWYLPWAAATAPDGRLRMRVRQTKVTSGRFSGERVNLLAIPHDKQLPKGAPTIRSFIRPREGTRLWEVDLGQAEVRVGAVAANCKPMVNAFMDGLDPYAVTARDAFGVLPCPTHPVKEPDPNCAACANFEHYRSLCKRVVLSTIYSGGLKTLIGTVKKFMDLDLPENEAQGFLSGFRKTYPEFGAATTKFEQFALQHSYVPLALGERRYFQSYEMMCSKCRGAGVFEGKRCRPCKGTGEQCYKALNQRIQGSVAAVMKPCMIEVDREFPGQLLLQIHDSLLLETADDTVPQRVAEIMRENFERVFKLPFTADIKEWH